MELIDTATNTSLCLNCKAEVSSNFCPDCGQRQMVKRLSLREGWNDFWARIYGFDGLFLNTLRDLTIKPGLAAREFVNGNRVTYYGPVGYFFLMITLYLIVASFLNIEIRDVMKLSSSVAATNQPLAGSGQDQFNAMILNMISDNLKLFSFLIIPFQALMAMLFFRKSRFNFIEHSVVPLYVTGHAFWPSIIGLFLYRIQGPSTYQAMLGLISIPLYVLACLQFYNYQSRWKVFVKSLMAYISAYFVFVIFFVVVIFIYVLSNPELLELLRPSNNR
jgi:hypothetical protein